MAILSPLADRGVACNKGSEIMVKAEDDSVVLLLSAQTIDELIARRSKIIKPGDSTVWSDGKHVCKISKKKLWKLGHRQKNLT